MGNAYRSVLALKPTGDAVPANVLAGKTFSNADGTGKTGTMVNNGAVSVTLTDQDPTYTIPEGYHNGSGVVGFSASGGDGADLIVTCSSDFAGATISCTDGTTTFQQICPSTTPFEVVFESIPVGTWTISGTAEGVLYSTQFIVVDFETALNSIPDGSTVIPTDDIQIWLNCANIWDKSYTTITQVLNDANTLQALIASNNAADYMARSTTWASDVTADQSAMSYIGLNDYCADALLADSTWLNAICNSTYFDSVFTTKVPTMTSDTTPSGTVFSSTPYDSSFAGYKAFDKDTTTSFATSSTAGEYHVGYEFPQSVKIYIAVITHPTGSSAPSRITSEKFQSYNGSTWVDETSQFSPIFGENKKILTNPISTTKHRFLYNQTSQAFITELQFYGRE